ncbi:HTH-like domain-containing protein [Paracidovorax citrulli]|nr:HTH-like domain-containing protein [Paracidovorax citrulli]
MDAEEARSLKELEVENARLKKLLAEAHLDLEALKIGFGGKALAPQDKRQAIARMLEHARISERRACRPAELSRDAWRHPPQPGACTVRLRERIHAVAIQRRGFGYRRVHDMLRSEFPGTKHKKVYRLYREQGLAVRRRNKARKYPEHVKVVVASIKQPEAAYSMRSPRHWRCRRAQG